MTAHNSEVLASEHAATDSDILTYKDPTVWNITGETKDQDSLDSARNEKSTAELTMKNARSMFDDYRW